MKTWLVMRAIMQPIGRTVMAGSSIGTRKMVSPACFLVVFFSHLVVRASTKHHYAMVAYDVQIFWPLIRHPSPSRVAAVRSEARSEPASGSLNP